MSLKFASKKAVILSGDWRILRQSQSKNLRFLRQIYAMNFWDTTLAFTEALKIHS